MRDIILASASPRRQELMHLVTPSFRVVVADVDETAVRQISAIKLAEHLAIAKCKAVADMYSEAVVIGCDTVVDIDGQAYGKPRDETDAKAMLSLLSGRWHLVHTGLAIACKGKISSLCETTKVFFATISPYDIGEYVKTQEPYDKAGGYGIQGWAAKYVYRIDGCYFNVMGLPVARLSAALAEYLK